MPRAIPYPIRQDIIQRHQAGQPLSAIAHELQLSYRTVRAFWQRYRTSGDAGLQTHYLHCGPVQRTFPYDVPLCQDRKRGRSSVHVFPFS